MCRHLNRIKIDPGVNPLHCFRADNRKKRWQLSFMRIHDCLIIA